MSATTHHDDLLHAMSQRLEAMAIIAHQQSALISSLVDAHEDGDTEAIKLALQRLSEHRANYNKPVRAH